VCCENRIRHRCGILGQCPHVQCICVTREHSSQVLCNQMDFLVKIEHFRFPGSPRNIFILKVVVSPTGPFASIDVPFIEDYVTHATSDEDKVNGSIEQRGRLTSAGAIPLTFV
jgi:hypothetical protein